MPVRVIVTAGSCADCKYGKDLIEGFEAEHLLADKAHDTDELLAYAIAHNIKIVIPPKRSRIEQREYDKHIYKHRHLVENAFMLLKQWRGIAFRFSKRTASFQAALQIRFIMMWLKIS
jgi:transposase